MNSRLSSEQMAQRAAATGSSLGSTSASSDGDHVRRDGFGETLSQLSRDVASLKDTFALFASQVGGEAAAAVRNMGEAAASQVGDAAGGVVDSGSDIASSAKQHAKTFTSELEAMARRNPLGTIAGTLMVGVIIGMMSRGRG
jgi:ElaB/YqjD/DUF883 family membrane-anchored ribosome-binding protein